ncbi:hypothetical protein EV645_8054 [Kribbella rubisoli]|uniref:Uncharacterized protein n=1 Tax=Kribbella rubisoli TaxID=3075929 RepID=A0A4Q7VZC3_9ACTN|nr:hypothetical protein [Kribbella rubisoli]RZU01938.1 hypothetical protein EV645_8054 [Kribbella rubisoli]
MKRLIRLYPARWRRQYGDEMSQVLDDLRPMSLRTRIRVALDLLRGVVDAHLTAGRSRAPEIGAALRRAFLAAGIVWVALSIEIVLSNVVFPTTEDTDGASVLISYLAVFGAFVIIGVLTARVTSDWRVLALAGGTTGVVIGALTIGTYAVIDNVFLDVISRQQAKIDGLAGSGYTSMRTYVNLSLLFGAGLLSVFLGVVGAGLAVTGGLARPRRTGSPYRPVP